MPETGEEMKKKDVLEIINLEIIRFESEFDDKRTLEILTLLERIRTRIENLPNESCQKQRGNK
jgi:hypothetical protein